MFSLAEYKIFVNQQIVNRVHYYGKDTTDYYLAFIYQFTKTVTEFFDKHPTTISKKFIHIFQDRDKPVSVSYNIWFLYKFGYKHCSKCTEIQSLNDFGKDVYKWDNLCNVCKICNNKQTRIYVSNNKEKAATATKKWQDSNKEYLKAYNDTYRRNNLAKDAARSMQRYCKKKKATPIWLSSNQQSDILAFYKQAHNLSVTTGVKYQVDHIIPIQGKNVCGLHVPWNLQVITAEENQRKNNNILLVDLLF